MAADPFVLARVLTVMPSLESIMYKRVEIEFSNQGQNPVEVTEYSVRWEGGFRSVKPERLTIPASGTATSAVKIYPDSGTLDSLVEENITIQVVVH